MYTISSKEVKSIKKVGVMPCFDLTIEDNHNLFYNSILVHNSDFRGEIGVILINHGKEPFTIQTGMKIAQGVFCPIAKTTFIVVDQLDETERGEGGFGSTGV